MSLDDKILGGPQHNYASSSEDEAGDSDEEVDNRKGAPKERMDFISTADGSELPEDIMSRLPKHIVGNGPRTGPKGVLADYKRYQQAQQAQKQLEHAQLLELVNKTALLGLQKEDEDDGFFEDEDDEFMKQYMEKRLAEMKNTQAPKNVSLNRSDLPVFGTLKQLSRAEYVDIIDNEHPEVYTIIHLFERFVPACSRFNECLRVLAKRYLHTHFFFITASEASDKFASNALPAILVYHKGELVCNHFCITDIIGEEFVPDEVEAFLLENRVLCGEATKTGDTGDDE
eukprot:Colp12_sorted_trinity150504_noHs@3841